MSVESQAAQVEPCGIPREGAWRIVQSRRIRSEPAQDRCLSIEQNL